MRDKELLQRYNAGERNFRGVQFYVHTMYDVDLSEADFSYASFATCGLRGVNFERSVFRNASIHANLTRANFRFADLQEAILCEQFCETNALRNSASSLDQSDLTGANLSHAYLCAVDFRSANLTEANLTSADLRSADLRKANLRKANLSKANLSNANLCHADLTGALMTGTNMEGAKLAGAILPDGTISQYETLEVINTKIRHLKRLAWKPLVQRTDGEVTASKFSGTPWLSVNETWPLCPHCQEPMQFFLQLDLEKLPPALDNVFGNGLLQLFYCTSSAECEGSLEGWAAFSKCHFLRIVQPGNMTAALEIPPIQSESLSKRIEGHFQPKLIVGWQQMDDYPSWADAEFQGVSITREELARISADAIQPYENDLQDFSYMDDENRVFNERSQRDCVVTNFMMAVALLPFEGDKLAGYPHWVQDVEYPNCPLCNRLMNQLVFEFASDDNVPYLWGDVGVGYILQCPEHKKELAFLWQCG